MSSKKVGLLILLATLTAAAIGVYTILALDSKKRNKKKLNDLSSYNKKFKFLRDNFFTRNSFNRVVNQISGLSIYNFLEIRVISVKYYLQTLEWSLGLLVSGAFITKDLIATCVVAAYALVMRTVLIKKRINDVHYKLLNQLSRTLSSIYENYTQTHDIAESIANCEKGDLLARPLDQIYLVLTANNSQQKLDEFYETSPYRLIRTLASSSYLLNDEGDAKDDEGHYAYHTALLLIKSEVDDEINKLLKQRTMFKALEYLPIVPMFVIGIIQSFFMSNIPGTSIVYKGMLGYISRLCIVLSSFISYYIITTINDTTTIRSNDRLEIIDNLLRVPLFNKLVKDVVPKGQKRKEKINKRLKGALSLKDIDYVYASKILCSAIGFVFSLFAMIVITYSAKEFTYKNVKSLSFMGGTELTAMEEKLLYELDCKYMSMDTLPEESVIVNDIQPILPKSTELDRLEQAERIHKKYKSYHSIYFKFWYVLLAYVIAIICWFIPEVQINLRKYLVKAEAQEDVLQMQTLIAILMHTQLDTLDVLYWLEKNSTVHKDALLYAYHEYPSDPEKALSRLKSKSAVVEFRQLCDKLISTISEVSLKEAFPDLIGQRENIMKRRETIQTEAINTKRRLASPVALAPIVILLIGHVILPIGLLGFQEFVNTFSKLGV